MINYEHMELAEGRNKEELVKLQQTAEYFSGASQELEAAGNHDMARYYAEKARAAAAEAAPSGEIRLGGCYGGYTAEQWRQKAKDEFIANGDSMNYKRYCDNAMKAKG